MPIPTAVLWTYEYYPDSGRLHVETLYHEDGKVDLEYPYTYTDRTVTIDIDDSRSPFPVDARELKTYNEAGQLILDEFDSDDQGPDGTIDEANEYIYDSGCLVRRQHSNHRVVDFSMDYTNDGLCNFLTDWRRIGSKEDGYESIGVYDYSCWK